jgi:hypothetical protein
MLTTEEQRKEAERLVDLDDRGLRVEAVALALRIREQQETVMAENVESERAFIRELGEREPPVHGDSEGDIS